MIGIFPLIFMGIFGGPVILSHGFVGMIVFLIGFISIVGPIQSIAWDKYTKLKEMIVAMPVHPVSYTFGIALNALFASIPALFFFIIIAAWYGVLSLTAMLWTAAALFLCWSSLSAFSFTVATYFPRTNPFTLSTIALVLGFVIVFLPPVYYPKETLGDYSWISFLVPTSNTASLIRTSLGISVLSLGNVAAHWLALVFTTIIFILLVSFKARWREI
jgi:ABC-type multidrug transport system permease subunit